MGQKQVILRHRKFRVSGASERANGRASGPLLTSLFLFVPDHSATVETGEEALSPQAATRKTGKGVIIKKFSTKGEGKMHTEMKMT